ncbi:MAG TPA: PadR family transcriptional regulator [Clostridiales bacterium]|nr:PadR family transcriptional regulator [Clostridiales bacterium]
MKKTRFVILGLLQEEDLSGYEIKKIINIRMSFFWQESYGQIYPELGKLREEGLIEQIPSGAGPKAKVEKIKYRITPEGNRVFKQWMEAENEKDTIRSEFLLKMYFSTQENSEEMKRHLMEFKEQADQKVALFQLFYQELARDIDMHNNHRQILKVLGLGLRQAQLYSDWSEEMLEELK